MAMEATFDIRRPTTGARHSTVGGRRLRGWRHTTFNSRLLVVGCHSAVGHRLSNVVHNSFSDATKGTLTPQENAVKNAVTTQEVAPKSSEVVPKNAGVAPKIAQKTREVAPKDTEVAPKGADVAPKNASKTNDVAPKDKELQESAVKNLVNDESVVEKCVKLWDFLKEDPQRTITNAVERLSCSRRSIVTYIGILKQAKVLEHIGPYRGGGWKFLI